MVEYRCSTAPMEPGAIFRAEGSGANFELFRHCRRLTAEPSGEKSNRGENVGAGGQGCNNLVSLQPLEQKLSFTEKSHLHYQFTVSLYNVQQNAECKKTSESI